MKPLELQLALAPLSPMGTSARVSTGPPAASMRFNLSLAVKPTDLPSGDQNVYVAASVPARGCAARESRERIQTWALPSFVSATNAIRCPSGDTETVRASRVAFSGGRIVART